MRESGDNNLNSYTPLTCHRRLSSTIDRASSGSFPHLSQIMSDLKYRYMVEAAVLGQASTAVGGAHAAVVTTGRGRRYESLGKRALSRVRHCYKIASCLFPVHKSGDRGRCEPSLIVRASGPSGSRWEPADYVAVLELSRRKTIADGAFSNSVVSSYLLSGKTPGFT